MPDGSIPPIAELQRAFPQLEILESIGRGGMGIVYKAYQPHLDRHVALKILDPRLAADPGFAERFAREARTLGKLVHPNIVGVHDFGEAGGFFWLLMEFVEGLNLHEAMRADAFTPAQALAIVPEICAALQFAHDHGVLHRDIKPENILLDAEGHVKVADFGIARLVGESTDVTLTRTGSALGSTVYMAPEQIERPHDVDHRADIYSLGVVLYEMLTGGLPIGRFPPPSERCSSDPGLDPVVLRALEHERDKRFPRADDVGREVRTAGTRTGAAVRPDSTNGVPGGTAVTPGPGSFPKGLAWSLGLLAGGGVAAAVGSVTSPTLLGLGLTAAPFGFLGCWWLLHRIRAGAFPASYRPLLLGVAFWPAIVAVAAWIGAMWLVVANPLGPGPTAADPVVGQVLHFVVAFLLAAIVARHLWRWLGPPQGEVLETRPRLHAIATAATIVIVTLNIVAIRVVMVQGPLYGGWLPRLYQVTGSGPGGVDPDAAGRERIRAAFTAATETLGVPHRLEFWDTTPPYAFEEGVGDRPGLFVGLEIVGKDRHHAERKEAELKDQLFHAFESTEFRFGRSSIVPRRVARISRRAALIKDLAFVLACTTPLAVALSVLLTRRTFRAVAAIGAVLTAAACLAGDWPRPLLLPKAAPAARGDGAAPFDPSRSVESP